MSKEILGSDPFTWIKDSRKEKEEDPKEESKQELQKLQSKQDVQNNISNIDKPDLLSVQSLPSKPAVQTPEVTSEPLPKKSTQKGLADGWTRATFIIKEEHLEKLKDYAYWERMQIKDALDQILTSFFERSGNRPEEKRS
jgi:hypothetical protein